MRFLGSKYANNAFAAGAPTRTPLGAYSPPPDPLAGKGERPPAGWTPEGGPPGKGRGRKRREGEGAGEGKIVATRCQILRLKCEDALYKCTNLLTYISSTIGCANFCPDWPLLFKVHEI